MRRLRKAFHPLTSSTDRDTQQLADRKERVDFLIALNAIVDDYDASETTDGELQHGERLRDLVVALLVFEGVRTSEDEDG